MGRGRDNAGDKTSCKRYVTEEERNNDRENGLTTAQTREEADTVDSCSSLYSQDDDEQRAVAKVTTRC
jgi:hypothetical protein